MRSRELSNCAYASSSASFMSRQAIVSFFCLKTSAKKGSRERSDAPGDARSTRALAICSGNIDPPPTATSGARAAVPRCSQSGAAPGTGACADSLLAAPGLPARNCAISFSSAAFPPSAVPVWSSWKTAAPASSNTCACACAIACATATALRRSTAKCASSSSSCFTRPLTPSSSSSSSSSFCTSWSMRAISTPPPNLCNGSPSARLRMISEVSTPPLFVGSSKMLLMPNSSPWLPLSPCTPAKIRHSLVPSRAAEASFCL
mmetsp:Transcript_16059/g.40903  ORF Transcript_16059/g.40903 Transcript_16059/m.40903 type:complete len:261 (-) Transcript_16059:555-1337(-)